MIAYDSYYELKISSINRELLLKRKDNHVFKSDLYEDEMWNFFGFSRPGGSSTVKYGLKMNTKY